MADVGVLDHALGAHHLEHLVADRVVVLEKEREVRADVDAALGLRTHHRFAQRAALLLVRNEVEDLFTGDRLRHFVPPCFAAGG